MQKYLSNQYYKLALRSLIDYFLYLFENCAIDLIVHSLFYRLNNDATI